jgi:hypothetical protein
MAKHVRRKGKAEQRLHSFPDRIGLLEIIVMVRIPKHICPIVVNTIMNNFQRVGDIHNIDCVIVASLVASL